MRAIWDFHGGIFLPENKHQTSEQPIADIDLPAEIILSLHQHAGPPACPLVKVGEKVLKGQIIADSPGVLGTAVHASSSGEIIAIENRIIAHPSSLPALCIVIKTDGLDRWCELNPCDAPEALDHDALLKKIRGAGLVGLGGAGFPTAAKLLSAKNIGDEIETLILNGCESEPYMSCDDRLMREHAEGIVQGALLLARIIGKPKNILVGIENNKAEAIASMRKAAIDTPVEIVEIPTKYPSGGEKQLIKILTNKEVPSGSLPTSVGVVVQNVATVYAAWRAIRFGEPLIERVITVAGEAFAMQKNIRVRIGTPISHIFDELKFQEQACSRLIVGGPMIGFSIKDTSAPVEKTTNCVLAPSNIEMPDAPPPQACIRCGACAEVCPANLLPQQLFWFAQTDNFANLQSHNLKDCIECGACSYVCPSAIPLVQYYRSAKAAIYEIEFAKQKADRARERFELRKTRIARAEAEKEVRRDVRKQAAALVKKELKALTENSPELPPPTTAGPIPLTEEISLASERKKLERAMVSAQSRVALLEHQLAENSDNSARAERFKAQIKQAQLKVDEAKNKLDGLDRGATINLNDRLQNIADRVKATPYEAQQRVVETLRKRMAVAQEKCSEAEQENRPTLDALRQGVEKLHDKLVEAEAELVALQNEPQAHIVTIDAEASAALDRAQLKLAAQKTITPQENLRAHIEMLNSRINQTQMKLNQAISDNSVHVHHLQGSLNKLQTKLKTSQDSLGGLSLQDADNE